MVRKKYKKKLFITTTVAGTLYFFGGQPRLWKKHFDVCAIAAVKEKLEAFAEQEGIRNKYIPMHREISLLSDMICLFSFICLFMEERPYVVHGNTPKASMLSMLAAWLTFRPVRIYMCHGLRYQTTSGFKLKLLMAMEWLSCHCSTNVIGVSKGVVEQLVADGLCPEHKAKVIGNGTAGGIDICKFSREAIVNMPDIRLELNIPNDAFVFCFVGRIVRDKGINELVNAFNRMFEEFNDVHLLLVGAPETDLDPIDVQSEIIIEQNSHIHAVGRQSDVRPYLAASDAFVLPSYREGVGMVLLEANAMGVPCIASDIIGCHDVVIPNINGELVKPRDAHSLYEKMKEWYLDREKVNMMARQCREFVTMHFSSDNVKNAYYQEYLRLAHISNEGV